MPQNENRYRTTQDLLAERRANILEMMKESDETAKKMLQAHVDMLDRELSHRRESKAFVELLKNARQVVVVMRGLSGSGKSTLARRLAARVKDSRIVSADTFFGEGEEYAKNFNVEQLNDAHAQCFRNFMTCVLDKTPLIFVDNTNSREGEIAPYLLGARAYGYEAAVLEVVCLPELAASRTAHNVPPEVISRMFDRLDKVSLPPWWTLYRVQAS